MRFCPHCNNLTEKSSGCYHMTCGNCYRHWCWCCGKPFDNSDSVYEHLNTLYRHAFPSINEIRDAHNTGRVSNFTFH